MKKLSKWNEKLTLKENAVLINADISWARKLAKRQDLKYAPATFIHHTHYSKGMPADKFLCENLKRGFGWDYKDEII